MRAPAIFDRTTIYGAIILVGLILHGVQAHRFGFYWSDDVMYFSLGYQQAGCSAMKYILSDTAIALNSDRPVSYVAWALARAAYAINLPTLHWLLVLLVISNAVITAVLARRIFNEEWFAFAVGILFLTYPISPLEAIWGATIHYLVATLLATVVMLFSLNGLESSGKRRRNWFIISTMTFLALLLTHEAYALLPPAFICCYAVSRRHGFPENPDWIRFGSFWYRKPGL